MGHPVAFRGLADAFAPILQVHPHLHEHLIDRRPTVFDKNHDFWEHEWSKHGTCALKVMSVLLRPVLLLQVLSICASPSKFPPSSTADNVCLFPPAVHTQRRCSPPSMLSSRPCWTCTKSTT